MGYVLTILIRLSQMLIMGVGIHVVFSLGGIMFLGFPVVAGMGGYAFAIALHSGISGPISILISLGVSLLTAGVMVYFYLYLSPDAFAVLGFAAMSALFSLTLSWMPVTNGALGINGIARPYIVSSLPNLAIATSLTAAILFCGTYVLLKSSFGRRLRGFRQSPITIDSQGISSLKVAAVAILFSSLLIGIAAIFMVLQMQFINPDFGGIAMLIEVLTIGILSLKPNLFRVMGATLFVTFLPETLRFFDISSAMMGHIRVLTYSVLLLLLLFLFRKDLTLPNREI